MNPLLIILIALIGYFFTVFIVLRLFVPFMGFTPKLHRETIPDEMKAKIREFEATATDARTYAELAYRFVQHHWEGGRFKTITRAALAFRTNLASIWNDHVYAHCNTINYVFYNLLTHSKFFKPEDIQVRHIFYNCFIHQHLLIKIDGAWVEADPATDYLNLPLGKRAHWFG